MMRVTEDVFEVVGAGAQVRRFATIEEARANRGGGQVRKRTLHHDVPAVYAVRSDDIEHGRFGVPAEAAALSRQHPGSRVVLVAAQ